MPQQDFERQLAEHQARLAQLEVQQHEARRASRRRVPVLVGLGLLSVVAGVALAAPPAVPGVPNTLVADTPARASQLNGNFANLAARSVPANTVIFFNGPECPVGWREFTEAQGRTIVVKPTAGSVGGQFGTPLTHQENRAATLGTSTQPNHVHQWAWFSGGTARDWYSYDSAGTSFMAIDYGDGIANAGAGLYPFAISSTTARDYYTAAAGTHAHSVTARGGDLVPYYQLLACLKL